jgi:1-acyl-sn-glycerol-3-phosphate acyltransferase
MPEREVYQQHVEEKEVTPDGSDQLRGEVSERQFEKSTAHDERVRRDQEAAENVRALLNGAEATPISPEERRQNLVAYQEKYLPEHVEKPSRIGKAAARVAGWWMALQEKMGRMKVEGRENVPVEGPCLIVSNHFGGETGKLLGLFSDRPPHVVAGEELNWKKSRLRAWVLRKLGMLSVKESLANLSDVEKTALLARVSPQARAGYEAVVERERSGGSPANLSFVHGTVAALTRGDRVAFFPEGLFLYGQKLELHRAYPGVELIAKEFERLTGQPLPILPVGIERNRVGVGAATRVPEAVEEERAVDQIMRQVAAQLPEEQRGAYR